jgi:hypothetical protein
LKVAKQFGIMLGGRFQICQVMKSESGYLSGMLDLKVAK